MLLPGFQSLWGTSTWIWRRAVSTVTFGGAAAELVTGPGALDVRDQTLAGRVGMHGQEGVRRRGHVGSVGKGSSAPSLPPSAIVNATSVGSCIVFRVIRNAVERLNGLTRNSTRSAALLPYAGSVGYV